MRGSSHPLRLAMLAALLVTGTLLAGPRPVGATPAGSRPARPADPWALGTFTQISGTVYSCPATFDCFKFKLTACPNVTQDDTGAVATSYPAGPPRGVVVFFRGGSGADWWAFTPLSQRWMAGIRDNDGFVVVQIRYDIGWLTAPSGQQIGPAHLACRTATVVQWIHDNIYLPLGINPIPGECGYCITGNSGGSSAVSYPLAFYGQDAILNAVVPTGGPDHAAITKACLLVGGYSFNDQHRDTIDESYGYRDPVTNPGPCHLSDPSWTPTWDADSVDIGGNDYHYPFTRVEFIEGGKDSTGAPFHAYDYWQKLLQDPANEVTFDYLPNMPHKIAYYQPGLNALEKALLKP